MDQNPGWSPNCRKYIQLLGRCSDVQWYHHENNVQRRRTYIQTVLFWAFPWRFRGSQFFRYSQPQYIAGGTIRGFIFWGVVFFIFVVNLGRLKENFEEITRLRFVDDYTPCTYSEVVTDGNVETAFHKGALTKRDVLKSLVSETNEWPTEKRAKSIILDFFVERAHPRKPKLSGTEQY